MEIAVMGAGAVGCYYGFKLARAGHDVVLIGRPQLVDAVEHQGLRLETQTFDEHIRVSASTEGSAVQGAQLVLFCVKSTDTENGAAAIKPHLAPNAVVLSLQNGVENADRLRALHHAPFGAGRDANVFVEGLGFEPEPLTQDRLDVLRAPN